MKIVKDKDFASFRDPSGYVYFKGDNVYRKIFPCYFKQYDYLMNSGLYDELVHHHLLVSHEEIKRTHDFIILKVKTIPFISYPYEWCFEQYKDAATLTLNILKISLKYNMVLKDASAYNIQFMNGRPIFIDTLSFEIFDNSSWGAYGQFCRHFMAPLLLMSYVDVRLSFMLKDYIDGIPLDLCSSILKSRGGMTARMHIKWHSRSIAKYDNVVDIKKKNMNMSLLSFNNMIDMMLRQINRLSIKRVSTEWDHYYDHTNYDELSEKHKVLLVKKYLKNISNYGDIVIDLGSNDGKYSRMVTDMGDIVISVDSDYNCVNRNYCFARDNSNDRILPLVLDFTNPSSNIGFACLERKSFQDRANAKCVMALAVIHHICISNNVSFDMIASWLSSLGEYLMIEFVPKDDSKVEKLLRTRKDIFDWYTKDNFEMTFSNYFEIIIQNKIKNSKRVLYLMRGKKL